jgi:hypothetical protein
MVAKDTVMNQTFVERRKVAITPAQNLMTEEEISRRLNVSVASLRRWRLIGNGPGFIKIGSLVRYRPEDLDSWLAALPKGGNTSRAAGVPCGSDKNQKEKGGK